MVDILCLTETHFEVTDVISARSFWKKKKGEVYRNDRVGRKCGGVAIVVSEKFISNQIHIDSQLEVVGVEVYCPSKVVVLLCLSCDIIFFQSRKMYHNTFSFRVCPLFFTVVISSCLESFFLFFNH